MKEWQSRKLGAVEIIFEEETDDDDADDDEEEEEEEGETQGAVEQKQKQQQEEDSEESEDDDDDDDDAVSVPHPLSPPLSPLSCSPTVDLDTTVEAWSLARRRRPDVKIHVQGTCFHLHKDVVCSRSGYLERQLMEVSEITLPASPKITPDTFKMIVQFCYRIPLTITPLNVAALRTAAEALEMAGSAGDGRGCESLRQKTENYFCRIVTANRDFALIVFRSCLSLLPEAEETVFLASRCLEVLCSEVVEAEEDGGVSCRAVEAIRTVRPEDFLMIADSMQRRFTRSHDFLYSVVDLYLKVYDGKMSEEQKTRICCCIDCNMVSAQLLMQVVQNPRMPLRFVVQAMLTEQLNTHRSICTSVTATSCRPCTNNLAASRSRPPWPDDPPSNSQNAPTLGALLQRDAALRQVAQLKAAVNTTTTRIHRLEKELSSMKKRLIESERHNRASSVVDSGRSASFRFSKETSSSSSSSRKIERGERGSISSDNLQRYGISKNVETTTPMKKNNLGLIRLFKGLKSVFVAGVE